ncbi:MAG: hypothetical protein ACD_11C00108G0039 [uncultured bacterium]|nr:MAG: hypothetical protein ACD_11C00108G0039 [uncultured bacterium]HBR71444.1 hypothetical protein [Candidatus Moranbacteria bacterium]
MNIFAKNKNYSIQEIIDICNKNNLITVDCLKDENMISIEEKGADCLFEFHRVSEDIFKLTYSDKFLLDEMLKRK